MVSENWKLLFGRYCDCDVNVLPEGTRLHVSHLWCRADLISLLQGKKKRKRVTW
ncbi:unnamed protein product, partial [marine sediment metagenome]